MWPGVEDVAAEARDRLLADGSLEPVIVVVGARAATTVGIVALPPAEGRRAFFRDVGARVRRVSGAQLGPLLRVVFVAQSWASIAPAGDAAGRRPPPSADPGRIECLLAAAYEARLKLTIWELHALVRNPAGALIGLRPMDEAAGMMTARSLLLETILAGYEAAGRLA